MMKKLFATFVVTLFLSCLHIYAQEIPTYSPADIDIPYTQFTLDNGLRLIVHEDHKAPIVAVNVWYHVGSKDEKAGKSGFAHLFEHLMFNGSENFDDDYFQALESIGATDLNGTTNPDRTNYFQTVPVGALDQVLWLESDRMSNLLGAINQEKLDEQIGVIKNEKRQGEDLPYGRSNELITKAIYPKGHPYSWTTIGEMEDLDKVSLEDVKEWFDTFYGAANAVLVIAGDIEADEAYEKVQKYFGSIGSGPTLVKSEVNIAKREEDSRQYYQDRVPEARIQQIYNIPEWGTKEVAYLDLVSDILSYGKNSRLYKKLVYEDQAASNVNAFIIPREIGGQFYFSVNVKPDKKVEEVERTMNKILKEFINEGPTEKELERVKAAYFANFIKGLERIGGFGGKSDILAQNAVFGGSPDFYKKRLQVIHEATIEDIRQVANDWLSSGKHTLICEPFPKYATLESSVDRSKLPEPLETKSAYFPELQQATLDNGLKVVLAQRKEVPTVVMRLIADGGYSVDPRDKVGLAKLTMNLADEGAENRSSLEINEQLQLLGASLSTYSSLDELVISMTTLKQALGMSLDLFADVIQNPAFPEKEFDRLKKQQLVEIEKEKAEPIDLALRVTPLILYGKDHPYGIPYGGLGYESTVNNITREDVVSYYNDWVKPNNATLVVVGDIELTELTSVLNDKLGGWEKGNLPKKKAVNVENSKGNRLLLIDRPESLQSTIIAAHLTKPYGEISEIAREAFINVLGGEFTSRVNLNLREDKHWSYGARTVVLRMQLQRILLTFAPVQTDKTKESIIELQKEFSEILSTRLVKEEEFEKTRGNAIMQLPGRWETNMAVARSVSDILTYDLEDDYYQTYGGRLKGLSLKEVHETGKEVLYPEKVDFFVVGDKEKILPSLRELEFSEIIFLDGDGHVLSGERTSDAATSTRSSGK